MMGAVHASQPKPRRVRGFVVSPRGRLGWCVFKALLFALLLTNVGLYTLYGTMAETVDTAAWLVLLGLFEFETGGWRLTMRMRPAVHALRALASLAVLAACAGYALSRQWLDFANAGAWFGVVALLEMEVRVPAHRSRFHQVRNALTWALYAALGAFVAVWIAQGLGGNGDALLDAWDASLWLLAFVAIELNLFGFRRVRGEGSPAAPA